MAASDRRQARLDLLHALAHRLAGAGPESRLTDAAALLMAGATARACVAFVGKPGDLEAVAARGLSAATLRGHLGSALRQVAANACKRRRPVVVRDVRNEPERHLSALAIHGSTAVGAFPIERSSHGLGAMVLAFTDVASLDDDSMRFIETVVSMVSASLSSEDQSATTASAVHPELLSASLLAEIAPPIETLELQLEEARRLIQEFTHLSDAHDPLLRELIASWSELTQDMDVVAGCIREIVGTLTDAGGKVSLSESVNLDAIVSEALCVVRPRLERLGVTLRMDVRRTGSIRGNANRLMLLLVQLLSAAADGWGSGVDELTTQVRVSVVVTEERALIAVSHVGPHVPSHQLRTMFRPLRGSGTLDRPALGLKLCADVARLHGGHVEVHDTPDGNEVVVALPARSAARAAPVETHDVRQRRVLIIDDDDVFARSLRRALKPHVVTTAATASEAEISLLSETPPPDIVLCDIFLPGKNGDQLHARVARSSPEIARRFVFVTGGGLTQTQAEYIRSSGCPAMAKPLDLGALRQRLADDPVHDHVRTLSSNPPEA